MAPKEDEAQMKRMRRVAEEMRNQPLKGKAMPGRIDLSHIDSTTQIEEKIVRLVEHTVARVLGEEKVVDLGHLSPEEASARDVKLQLDAVAQKVVARAQYMFHAWGSQTPAALLKRAGVDMEIIEREFGEVSGLALNETQKDRTYNLIADHAEIAAAHLLFLAASCRRTSQKKKTGTGALSNDPVK